MSNFVVQASSRVNPEFYSHFHSRTVVDNIHSIFKEPHKQEVYPPSDFFSNQQNYTTLFSNELIPRPISSTFTTKQVPTPFPPPKSPLLNALFQMSKIITTLNVNFAPNKRFFSTCAPFILPKQRNNGEDKENLFQQQPKVTINKLNKKFKNDEKISMITAYDFSQACLVEKSSIDILLVGDSLGMVTLGYNSTIPVTMNEMLHHCKAVKNGAKRPLLVGDLPFGSYEIDSKTAFQNALTLIKEGGMDAVKLEGGAEISQTIKLLTSAGIAVMGHIGLQPQKNCTGPYRYFGQSEEERKKLKSDAKALEEAGCFAIILECVFDEVAQEISKDLNIPCIGIGAGKETAGQVIVWHDLIGWFDRQPKFCTRYDLIGDRITNLLNEYHDDVISNQFPFPQNCRSLSSINKSNIKSNSPSSPSSSSSSPSEIVTNFEGKIISSSPSLSYINSTPPPISPSSNQLFNNNFNSSSSIDSTISIIKKDGEEGNNNNNNKNQKKVLIIGSGSMALLFAGLIKKNNQSKEDVIVCIFDPFFGSQIDFIEKNENCFTLQYENEMESINVITAKSEEDVLRLLKSPADFAIFLAKSYQLPQKEISMEKLVKEEGIICLLQNGMGMENYIKYSPSQIFIRGITSFAARMISSFHILQTAFGSTSLILPSSIPSLSLNNVEKLKEILNFKHENKETLEITNNENPLYEKLLINAAINPITALLEVPNGHLNHSIEIHPLIYSIVEESLKTFPFLLSSNSSSFSQKVEEYVEKVRDIAKLTSKNESSMLSDIKRGSQTEVDFINGFIITEAKKKGILTPVNSMITSLIKSKSKKI